MVCSASHRFTFLSLLHYISHHFSLIPSFPLLPLPHTSCPVLGPVSPWLAGWGGPCHSSRWTTTRTHGCPGYRWSRWGRGKTPSGRQSCSSATPGKKKNLLLSTLSPLFDVLWICLQVRRTMLSVTPPCHFFHRRKPIQSSVNESAVKVPTGKETPVAATHLALRLPVSVEAGQFFAAGEAGAGDDGEYRVVLAGLTWKHRVQHVRKQLGQTSTTECNSIRSFPDCF